MANESLYYEKTKIHHVTKLTDEQLEEIGPINYIDVPPRLPKYNN